MPYTDEDYVEETFGSILCDTCKHSQGDVPYCKAFPDGIPLDILSGGVNHIFPYEGDNGIQYEPK